MNSKCLELFTCQNVAKLCFLKLLYVENLFQYIFKLFTNSI